MKYSGEELYSGDAVADLMARAGFEKDRIQVLSRTQIVTGEDLEGLTEFASGPFMDPAKAGWTDDEKIRWQEVLRQVMEEEVREFGGVKFEGWAVFATR